VLFETRRIVAYSVTLYPCSSAIKKKAFIASVEGALWLCACIPFSHALTEPGRVTQLRVVSMMTNRSILLRFLSLYGGLYGAPPFLPLFLQSRGIGPEPLGLVLGHRRRCG
jgi:hypothetical protein